VGFIAEDVPDLVATPDRKGVASIDIVALLTKVVQQQQTTLQQQQKILQQQQRTIAELSENMTFWRWFGSTPHHRNMRDARHQHIGVEQ
jgi:hypothetical protein